MNHHPNARRVLNPALALLTLLLCSHLPVLSQPADEAEIRNLERLEVEALLKVDTAALYNKYWSPGMVINTPANRVGTVEDTKRLLLAGMIDYSFLERNIEKITFNENIAIVMGHEKMQPRGVSSNAGKIVTRRFTNIWMKSRSGWSIVARQATVISVE